MSDLARAMADLSANLNGNGKLSGGPSELCEQLTDRLGLAELGLEVVGATVFGTLGPRASVDLRLSDGRKITFERFGDIAKPAMLTTYLVTTVGVARSFKAPQAVAIAALIQRLADHQVEASADEAAREWGSDYLRAAPMLEVDLSGATPESQAERWACFCALKELNPGKDLGEDRSSWAYAAATMMLVDRATGERLVRTGWFQAYVRREHGGGIAPADLATLMLRVGWRRRGRDGWIKATEPDGKGQLRWRFYSVPAGWEDA